MAVFPNVHQKSSLAVFCFHYYLHRRLGRYPIGSSSFCFSLHVSGENWMLGITGSARRCPRRCECLVLDWIGYFSCVIGAAACLSTICLFAFIAFSLLRLLSHQKSIEIAIARCPIVRACLSAAQKQTLEKLYQPSWKMSWDQGRFRYLLPYLDRE